ncbi:NAD(P)/FAD-dependent oxidoreductase [Arthrobacter sp. CJ23]|uniref:FAD-dependent oxidoreductase n=1 Tax=Arthrobacter sp. CJ23 TaxID=2972479 RepID=UPI00215CB4CC|nr:NAD(P)/FAD-dependent oxidoreductase [Arthrobacter sp. CJ23]UVJ37756.1 FAD-dependent monooxygenase [Arthrobacter sp. CJ23]
MHDVIIVGAGPVGLFMGALLLRQGLDVSILEQRGTRSGRSRAIGIHPPALAVLDTVAAAAPLAEQGVRIVRGTAYSRGRRVAGLDFSGTSPEFPFILSVPQASTEQVLEDIVRDAAPEALRRGVEVLDVLDAGGSVLVRARLGDEVLELSSRLVIAADGAHSRIRGRLGQQDRVRHYPDCYIMGDFGDSTPHGHDAVLFLEPEGIVECFPLPGGIRRWVVRLGEPCMEPTAELLAHLIRVRTGTALDAESNSMLSAFEVRSRLARRTIHGRVALLGDAAHEISPIGGQGMNLGWLDAAALAPLVGMALAGRAVGRELQEYERSRHHVASRAAWQAGLNMALGRPLPPQVLAARNRMFAGAIAIPAVADLVARRFTMH